MKQAVLYEAHYSDETIQANKELLCKLMNEQEVEKQCLVADPLYILTDVNETKT